MKRYAIDTFDILIRVLQCLLQIDLCYNLFVQGLLTLES